MNADSMMQKPAAQWRALLEKATPEQRAELEAELFGLMQRMAVLGAYVARRYNTGCGDQGHEASAKHAQRVLVKIRRALGYTYPAQAPEYLR